MVFGVAVSELYSYTAALLRTRNFLSEFSVHPVVCVRVCAFVVTAGNNYKISESDI